MKTSIFRLDGEQLSSVVLEKYSDYVYLEPIHKKIRCIFDIDPYRLYADQEYPRSVEKLKFNEPVVKKVAIVKCCISDLWDSCGRMLVNMYLVANEFTRAKEDLYIGSFYLSAFIDGQKVDDICYEAIKQTLKM